MKKSFCVLFALLFALCAFLPLALGEDAAPVRLAALKGPTAMGLVKLLADAEDSTASVAYDFTLAGSADEITPKIIQGQLDIAAVPINLAAVLYNKTQGGVTLLAVNALGVLSIVEKGESVADIADLKGKTLYATGRGSAPEYALTYLLAQSGLTIGQDVIVEWKSEPAEVVALMAARENAIAMLPQPYVTVAQAQLPGLRVAVDLTRAWDDMNNGSRMITAGIIARTEFVQSNPEAVQRFLSDYALSAAYVNENLAEASLLIERYGIVKAAVAEKALPGCNIVCLTGDAMQTALGGYLQALYDLNPASVGGQLPEDDFYYNFADEAAQ